MRRLSGGICNREKASVREHPWVCEVSMSIITGGEAAEASINLDTPALAPRIC
jgi:hypothetical protein